MWIPYSKDAGSYSYGTPNPKPEIPEAETLNPKHQIHNSKPMNNKPLNPIPYTLKSLHPKP